MRSERVFRLLMIIGLLVYAIMFMEIDMPNTVVKTSIGLKEVTREQVVQALKNKEDYINKGKEKEKEIEKIKERSYFYNLKETGILNENNTINYLNKFQAYKLVKDSAILSNFAKSLPSKELIDNFDQMNDKDKISSIIVIISRNEFKDEYKTQLESANASIFKEEKKTKADIEKLEKQFDEEFNKSVEKQLQMLNKTKRYRLVELALIILIAILVPRLIKIVRED